eukprot:3083034-Rhodomonas_salina.1
MPYALHQAASNTLAAAFKALREDLGEVKPESNRNACNPRTLCTKNAFDCGLRTTRIAWVPGYRTGVAHSGAVLAARYYGGSYVLV